MKGPSNKSPQIAVNEGIDENVTVEDVVRFIQRGPGSERLVQPPSPAEETKTPPTGRSRWSMMKSVIGMQKPRASIYTGYTHHNDYQRYRFFFLT